MNSNYCCYFDMEFDESCEETFDMEVAGIFIVEGGRYAGLPDKPKIEGNTLVGDKTFLELGLLPITPQEIDKIFDDVFYGGN